jgi:phosphoesterase RecJ-like protein
VEIRMYIRQELSEQYRLNAAEVFREVPGMERGTVWGYALFAGYRAKGDLQALLRNIVQVFAKLLAPRG